MRTNLRPQFDGGANYYKLLELTRMIESENFYEDAKTEAKPTNQKGKAKVDVVTIDNTAQQIQQLQGAVKGLTKLIQGNRQNTQPVNHLGFEYSYRHSFGFLPDAHHEICFCIGLLVVVQNIQTAVRSCL